MSSISHILMALDTAVIIGLLGFAAWRDVLTRTIPDSISVALIGFGCVARLCDGWAALAASVLVGISVFIILLPPCSRGLLGGADLKLLAGLAVGFSLQTTLQLMLAVTVVGGVLALVYVGLNRLGIARAAGKLSTGRARSLLRRLTEIECWRIRRGAPLPYGLAIAIGAAIVVLNRQGV